jgi:hypothetical protein
LFVQGLARGTEFEVAEARGSDLVPESFVCELYAIFNMWGTNINKWKKKHYACTRVHLNCGLYCVCTWKFSSFCEHGAVLHLFAPNSMHENHKVQLISLRYNLLLLYVWPLINPWYKQQFLCCRYTILQFSDKLQKRCFLDYICRIYIFSY